MTIDILRDKTEMIEATRRWQAAGDTVCLVPTMGSIHTGHLALIEKARQIAARTVVSIYVNPTQFSPSEDFDSYPRRFEADCAAIRAAGGADAIYAPADMYGDKHATMIVPGGVALPMEGETRPHFFAGVATVVHKLFTHVPADRAIFGEKDFQQLAVIRQMVRDMDIPIDIIGHPTIRESDGLALSSRNHYLTPQQRSIAPTLYAEMLAAAVALNDGIAIDQVLDQTKATLISAGFDRIDYFDLRRATDLQPSRHPASTDRLFAAVWLGQTRLIDNCQL